MKNIYFLGKSRFLNKNHREAIRHLLNTTAINKGQQIGCLNYVFVDDEEIFQINMEHLQHDTYTDIITFDLRDNVNDAIEGEIYISVDRVKDNAETLGVSEELEMIRVISHGLLHLLGYKDKSTAQAKVMRQEEEASLSLWASLGERFT